MSPPRISKLSVQRAASAACTLSAALATIACTPAPDTGEARQAVGSADEAAPAAAVSPRIMVVGDSISQGLEGDFTWRYRLSQHLGAAGVTAQFVGPWTGTTKTGPWTGVSGDPSHVGAYRPGISFQSDNMAEWGWMLAEAEAAIADRMKTFTPSYLLVELGFNDIAWNLSDTPADQIATSVLGSLQGFVTNARAVNPSVRILVANVPSRTPIETYPELPGKLDAYNARVAGVVAGLSTAQSPVFLVDFHAAYNPNTDTYDGLHPNVRGEYVIAKAFADQLAARFGIGAAMTIPSSLPASLTPGPTGAITAIINSDWSASLSWPHVFGAGGFWIWIQDLTNFDELHKLPFPVGADGWRAALLAAGHTYSLKVQTMRGDYASDFSPAVQFTAPALALPRITSITPGLYSATVSWTAVPNADDYQVYAGGDCNSPAPSTTDFQLVQWGLGSATSWTQTFITGLCNNYFVTASRNGGATPRQPSVRVFPLQDNFDHYWARQHFWVDEPDSGDVHKLSNVGGGTDRGIVVARGFIADNNEFDKLTGDHRSYSNAPNAAAKVTVAWDTATGDVAIYVHKSCIGPVCQRALPIELTDNAASTSDFSTAVPNLFSISKSSNGTLSIQVSALNAFTPISAGAGSACALLGIDTSICTEISTLGRISDTITLAPSGSSFNVTLHGDKYPSWEFVHYPSTGPLGSQGIAPFVGTRGQTNVLDLKGAPTTCHSPSENIEAPNPMTCG